MTAGLTIHYEPEADPNPTWPDPHQDRFSKTYLGFWLYLMTDCILFASLFITYAVLHKNTFGGPGAGDLFELSTALTETLILLTSSVSCGFALLAAGQKNTKASILWLCVTAVLGFTFLWIEGQEFTQLLAEGHSWKKSAFLSSFFALVGTHGAHITAGLVWLFVMVGQAAWKGITADSYRRLVLFGLFWHFLDLIWIFIFTFVYLVGVL
jgi:cytochrome o ubiquinol oxidase subunit 3